MTLAIMIIVCVVVQLVDGNMHVSEVTMKNSSLELVVMHDHSNYVFSVSMETVLVVPLIMHWLLLLVVSAFVHICIYIHMYKYIRNYICTVYMWIELYNLQPYVLNRIESLAL